MVKKDLVDLAECVLIFILIAGFLNFILNLVYKNLSSG